MTISYYERGEHPAGFIGFRVQVYINRIPHQEYFPTRRCKSLKEIKAIGDKAKVKESALIKKRVVARRDIYRNAIPRSTGIYPTGVSCIGIRKSLVYGYITFRVVVIYNGERCPVKSFRIDHYGQDNAWYLACKHYAQCKKIHRWKHLLKRKHSIPRHL